MKTLALCSVVLAPTIFVGLAGCGADDESGDFTGLERTRGAASTPGAPSVPSVSQVGSSAALKLNFTAPNAGYVAIDRRYVGCGSYCYDGNVHWSNSPISSWTDTSVKFGVKYSYKVWNASGHNGYSDGVAPVQGTSAPPAATTGPLSLPSVAQVSGSAALKLQWSGGNGGYVAIDRRYPGCGSYCYEGNVHWSNSQINSWTDTNVSYGKSYSYKVWNSAGTKGYSPDVSVTQSGTQSPPVAQGGLPPGKWKLKWNDEFTGSSGSPAASHWMTYPAWSSGPRPGDYYWRDAVNSPNECYHDGSGNLVLRTRYVNGERRACYLTTGDNGDDPSRWHTFGPGSKGTYIEFRANISKMKAFAAWFAMWLMSPNNTYDGKTNTGTEIDVMEYVPFTGPNYSLMNLFHSAVWWGDAKGTGSAEPPAGNAVDDWGQINAGYWGADLTQNAFHTWGVEWYDDKQVFYFDGHPFWTNDRGVSNAEVHTIRLSIEIQNGNPYNLWGHPVGKFEDNPASRLPSHALVDYVRVYDKQ